MAASPLRLLSHSAYPALPLSSGTSQFSSCFDALPLRAALKWQCLKPYEKFAELVDRHWDGIAAYCHPDNKIALGFMEVLNNKIRVIQRRAYGLRDEEYLRLKILTCMLPEL
jgi:hypothetical protein